MKSIVVLSDTHHSLDNRFSNYFKNADEIWHAGDIGSLTVTDKLNKYAVLRAVSGNIDNYKIKTIFKPYIYFKCEDVKIIMTHIGGYPGKYAKKTITLINQYNPDLFVCGHSHILKVMYDKKYNLLHMNPGSIGDEGQHKVKTLLSFIIDKHEIKNLKVIEFPRLKKSTNSIC